ncbi:MAG: DEAD/DEAH box helicase [Clostridiales bacterium]|nr:DEAD/DEAH box helicase [Clostridiales bacterium]
MVLQDKTYRIEINYSDIGMIFNCFVNKNRVSFPISEELRFKFKAGKSDLISLMITLDNMFDDGIIDEENGNYSLLYEDIYKFEEYELSFFGISQTPVNLCVETDGLLALDFSIRYYFELNSSKILFEEHGNLIDTINGLILTDQHQYELIKLCKSIQDYETPEERMVVIAEIKVFANYKNIQLDKYLLSNEYFMPDVITIDPIESDKGIHLIPEIVVGDDNIHVENGIEESFISSGKNGKRKRTFINNKIKEDISEINKLPLITGSDIPKFYENPLQFIPESIDINIDELSERVKGIKKVVYKSSPFISSLENDRGWFDIEFEAVLTDKETGEKEKIDLDEYKSLVEKAKEEGQEYIKYNDAWVHVDVDSAEEYMEKMEEQEKEIPPQKMRLVFDIFMNVDNLEYSEEIIRLSNVYPAGVDEIQLIDEPTILKADLYDYQKIGYSWLYNNQRQNNGSLLADDMGLGKTLQVIALLSKNIEDDVIMPSLLVLPKSLISNWQAELEKFVDRNINSYMHIGPGRYKDIEKIEQYDLVFVTYETLARDQLILGKIHWKYVILDEAQKIKNISTYATIACKALMVKHKIALTGTPVENNLQELWSIIDFVQPGHLGALSDFKDNYQNPIEKDKNYAQAEKLQEKLNNIMLRRIKKDILKNLPEKIENPVYVSLTANQNLRYQLILDEYHNSIDKNPLPTLQKLLQLSSHFELINSSNPTSNMICDGSNKIIKTLDMLKEIARKGDKALIFTRFKKMQVMLQVIIMKEFGFKAKVINGDVTGNRHSIVERFNQSSGFNVLVLSPKAAGVGLNITGANHVIHYTREWNPAVENQATDRAYRIGQDKPVNVYYMITQDTVEVKLHQLLEEKRALFENTIIPSESLKIKANEFEL